MLVVGDVDRQKIESLSRSVEAKIKRKLRVMVMDAAEFDGFWSVLLSRPNWKII